MRSCAREKRFCRNISTIITDGLIPVSKKEQDTMKDMHIVQEMYARGYEFLPIDIYRAKATKFQIIDGKLMPPFVSIDGMGEKAAEAVEKRRPRTDPICPGDDFRQRTKGKQDSD